ncbi:HutD family protein [Cetobacterium sp. ZOR0034]|uniref:HutD family protein n=1 Tax=Cetobacterium sp. ZOR0034 TaxID=1339239 RepID=UPI00064618D3|nr:HutD family protein [Cetobacterium sp. ZOR0034]
MDYKIIRKENQKESSWAGGVSKELYIFPDGSTLNSPFNFRVSTATINKGAYTFTHFNNYKRLLILLKGHIKLEIDSNEYLLNPMSHIFFSGDSNTKSVAEEDSEDFNLIFKEDVELLTFHITDKNLSGEILSNKAINIFYNLENTKHIYINNNEYLLESGDTAIVCGNNFKVEGEGKGIVLSLNIK